MVGFNRKKLRMCFRKKQIYIPLWSDSIVFRSPEFRLPEFIYIPLWSDSICPALRFVPVPEWIYIPLWSDSIIFVSGSYWILLQIYIPLWSDSISRTKERIRYDNKIYIPLWSDSIVLKLRAKLVVGLFTFHYGRIQSFLEPVITVHRSYLHSIMVGFNRDVVSYQGGAYLIYIPLWSDSIYTGSEWSRTFSHIYIPLWSDSILSLLSSPS